MAKTEDLEKDKYPRPPLPLKNSVAREDTLIFEIGTIEFSGNDVGFRPLWG